MPVTHCFRQMSAPTYVIGFLLILTGLIGFFTQTPYLSIYPSGKFEDGLEMTLAAEDAPTLEFDYYSLGSHSDKEQAEALAEEIMLQGNSGEHQGWYAVASGDEKSPKLQIFRKDGLSLSVNDWSAIKDGSGAQPKGTMSFGKSPTALIPSLLGLLIIACVIGSQRKENLRKLLMHIAAGIGLLGTIAPGKMAWSSYSALAKVKETLGELPLLNPNTQPPSPVKFLSQGVTAVLCFFFLILCIQSFVKARKQQAAAKRVARPPLSDPKKPKSTEGDKKSDSDKDKDEDEDELPSMKKKLADNEEKENEDSQKSKGESSNKPLRPLSSDKKKADLKSPQPSSAKKSPDKPSLSQSIAGKPTENAPSSEKKPKDDNSDSRLKSGVPPPSGKKDGGPMPLPPRPKVTPSKTLPSSDKKAIVESKPEDDKKDPIKKSGPPPASPKKDLAPLPPPASQKAKSGKTLPPSDKKAAAKSEHEGDKKDTIQKSGPPTPSGTKERGPLPPPPKESSDKPPRPPGSPPAPKSNLTDSSAASPKETPSDQKVGKFRLSDNKPLRINRPQDTPSSTDKKEDDANE